MSDYPLARTSPNSLAAHRPGSFANPLAYRVREPAEQLGSREEHKWWVQFVGDACKAIVIVARSSSGPKRQLFIEHHSQSLQPASVVDASDLARTCVVRCPGEKIQIVMTGMDILDERTLTAICWDGSCHVLDLPTGARWSFYVGPCASGVCVTDSDVYVNVLGDPRSSVMPGLYRYSRDSILQRRPHLKDILDAGRLFSEFGVVPHTVVDNPYNTKVPLVIVGCRGEKAEEEEVSFGTYSGGKIRKIHEEKTTTGVRVSPLHNGYAISYHGGIDWRSPNRRKRRIPQPEPIDDLCVPAVQIGHALLVCGRGQLWRLASEDWERIAPNLGFVADIRPWGEGKVLALVHRRGWNHDLCIIDCNGGVLATSTTTATGIVPLHHDSFDVNDNGALYVADQRGNLRVYGASLIPRAAILRSPRGSIRQVVCDPRRKRVVALSEDRAIVMVADGQDKLELAIRLCDGKPHETGTGRIQIVCPADDDLQAIFGFEEPGAAVMVRHRSMLGVQGDTLLLVRDHQRLQLSREFRLGLAASVVGLAHFDDHGSVAMLLKMGALYLVPNPDELDVTPSGQLVLAGSRSPLIDRHVIDTPLGLFHVGSDRLGIFNGSRVKLVSISDKGISASEEHAVPPGVLNVRFDRTNGRLVLGYRSHLLVYDTLCRREVVRLYLLHDKGEFYHVPAQSMGARPHPGYWWSSDDSVDITEFVEVIDSTGRQVDRRRAKTFLEAHRSKGIVFHAISDPKGFIQHMQTLIPRVIPQRLLTQQATSMRGSPR